jgi:hypothetical protein
VGVALVDGDGNDIV